MWGLHGATFRFVTEIEAGATLPPVLACIPIDPSEYTGSLGQQWLRARMNWQGDGIADPEVYSGSIIKRCARCKIRVGVAPKQQAALDLAGVQPVILCLLCSVTVLHDRVQDGHEPPHVID